MTFERRVVIVQPYVPTYRVPMFAQLRERLAQDRVDLRVVAGHPHGDQSARGDSADAMFVDRVRSSEFHVFGHSIGLKRVARQARGADLVISELKATALENYWLTLRFRKRHALWGHVYPTVGVGSRVDLRVERWMMNRAAHVFAYTDNGGKAALAAGVAPPHITVLRNSVDTSGLRSAIADVSTDDIERFQAAHGLRGGPVVASIGALDDSKRIGFLLEATEALRSRIPGLGVIIAGDGPLASEVREFARLRPNVSAIGRAGNFEKAIISHLASALLNPGRVGLIAVESLVMGTPLITTDWPYHSVEFEYLRTGENALVTADSVEEFVRDTVDVLNHPQRLEFLRTSALEDSLRYDLSATVERFATGILSALDEQTASRNDLW